MLAYIKELHLDFFGGPNSLSYGSVSRSTFFGSSHKIWDISFQICEAQDIWKAFIAFCLFTFYHFCTSFLIRFFNENSKETEVFMKKWTNANVIKITFQLLMNFK